MKYGKISSSGSFNAWGIGFHYDYDSELSSLSVGHVESKKPLLSIDFDSDLAKEAVFFVGTLEKATQVKALMLSNNKTADLSKIMDEIRLPAMLASAASLARYGFDLRRESFERFGEFFCKDFPLNALQIKKISGYDPNADFYSATLETKRRLSVSVSSQTLCGTMLSLSDGILRDILTREFGSSLNSTAHALLRTSAKLSTLSLLLNEDFKPLKKTTKIFAATASQQTRISQ